MRFRIASLLCARRPTGRVAAAPLRDFFFAGCRLVSAIAQTVSTLTEYMSALTNLSSELSQTLKQKNPHAGRQLKIVSYKGEFLSGERVSIR